VQDAIEGGAARRACTTFARRGPFRLRRHQRPAAEYRAERKQRFQSGDEVRRVQIARSLQITAA
jgi:hypothetical protein